MFYDIEDCCYRTFPDGDKATGQEINKVIESLQKQNTELKEQLKYEEDWRIKCAKERDEAIKDTLKIVQENQSLKGRIDKVIFFISTTFDHYLVDEYIKKNLLEILKGG